MQTDASALLSLSCVTKDFGEGQVLRGIDLSVREGEFLTLLGPSGCGKTTSLRIIAGLETPTTGRVYLEGQDITDLPPEKRHVNMVFQNYALFPHMNVFDNIAYGLRTARVKRAEIKPRVADALRLVRLEGYDKRMPTQLSGGQRQRVAIARALVLKPRVLLLDEPLGALDLKLRQEMQGELKKLQQSLGITFVYITHDQEEALNMSTRIAVMRDGRVEQIGSPDEVYERPETLFTAGFIGQTNLLRGTVAALGENGAAALAVGGFTVPVVWRGAEPLHVGEKMALCLRAQRVSYGDAPKHGIHLSGVISAREYVGGIQRTRVTVSPDITLTAIAQTEHLDKHVEGTRVFVWWDPQRAPLVPDDEDDLPTSAWGGENA